AFASSWDNNAGSIVEQRYNELWSKRRDAIEYVEATRLELIKALIPREQKQKEEERKRQIQVAIGKLQGAIQTTQVLARQIEIEKQTEKLAALAAHHARAEQRESELLRALRKLMMTDEERAAAEAAKLDGLGCGDLPFERCIEDHRFFRCR